MQSCAGALNQKFTVWRTVRMTWVWCSPAQCANAARTRGEDKLSCDLEVDIQAGDELQVIRGGNIGRNDRSERYFAGPPQSYYDPVGGALTGLEHKEVTLLRDNIIDLKE